MIENYLYFLKYLCSLSKNKLYLLYWYILSVIMYKYIMFVLNNDKLQVTTKNN